MIDFSGWWDNWEWSGALYTDVPKGVRLPAMAAGVVGIAGVIGSWAALGVLPPLWAVGLVVVALVIDGVSHGLVDEWEVMIVSYALACFGAGVLACLALAIPATAVKLSFAGLAPCLALVFGPFTTRAVGATLFAHRMIAHANQQKEELERGLAGEPTLLIVSVRGVSGDTVDLTTLEDNPQLLRATWTALEQRPIFDAGDHLLVREPTIGDLELPDGYRNHERVRRLSACASSRYLGRDLSLTPASVYWEEVRAGVVVLVLEHAVIGIIGVVLA